MRAYLQLMRLPAVFTALSDIGLGFLLNHRGLGDDPAQLALLLGSSAGLYLAGMVLNDVFDRRLDAVERPERPIPSGRVSVTSATALGVGLLAAGLLAAFLAGTQSLAIAGGLAATVILYNAILKPTRLGPVAMGACRFLNVMLGASAAQHFTGVWTRGVWQLAAALGVYIAGVTWFARNEAGQSRRASLAAAIGVVNAGLAGVVAHIVWHRSGEVDPWSAATAISVIGLVINRRLLITLMSPAPERVQAAVKILLMSYVVLEATLAFYKTGDPIAATAILALLVPAILLGRWIAMT